MMSRISQFLRSSIDTASTLWARPRAAKRGSSQGRSLRGALCLAVVAASMVVNQPYTFANDLNSKDNLKLYAFQSIIDSNELSCFAILIHRESSWNYKSRNGSHYGLAQMRSVWYSKLSPRRQIDEAIKYYEYRYGSICEALDHSMSRGWA